MAASAMRSGATAKAIATPGGGDDAVPCVDPRQTCDRRVIDIARSQRQLEDDDRGEREDRQMVKAGERPIEQHRRRSFRFDPPAGAARAGKGAASARSGV